MGFILIFVFETLKIQTAHERLVAIHAAEASDMDGFFMFSTRELKRFTRLNDEQIAEAIDGLCEKQIIKYAGQDIFRFVEPSLNLSSWARPQQDMYAAMRSQIQAEGV